MTLPVSGAIGAGMINVELGNTATTTFALGSSSARYLANVFTGPIGYGSFYGKALSGNVPTPEFTNPGFETGTTTGWNFVNSRFKFNSSGNTPTVINGVAAPPDPDPDPYSSPGDTCNLFQSGPTYTSSVSLYSSPGVPAGPPGGLLYGAVMQSTADMDAAFGYNILYGPYIYSTNPVIANVGQTLSFYWRAYDTGNPSTSDAYCVRAYAFTSTGQYITLLNQTASAAGTDSGWVQSSTVIGSGQAGYYYFCFVCGSYDATGGTVLGSTLLLDEVVIT